MSTSSNMLRNRFACLGRRIRAGRNLIDVSPHPYIITPFNEIHRIIYNYCSGLEWYGGSVIPHRAYFSSDLNLSNDKKIGFCGTIFHDSLSSTDYTLCLGTFLIFMNDGRIRKIHKI